MPGRLYFVGATFALLLLASCSQLHPGRSRSYDCHTADIELEDSKFPTQVTATYIQFAVEPHLEPVDDNTLLRRGLWQGLQRLVFCKIYEQFGFIPLVLQEW